MRRPTQPRRLDAFLCRSTRMISFSSATIEWLKLQDLAEVEVTSEADGYRVETVFNFGAGPGWRAASAGIQRIRLFFDQPQLIKRMRLQFNGLWWVIIAVTIVTVCFCPRTTCGSFNATSADRTTYFCSLRQCRVERARSASSFGRTAIFDPSSLTAKRRSSPHRFPPRAEASR